MKAKMLDVYEEKVNSLMMLALDHAQNMAAPSHEANQVNAVREYDEYLTELQSMLLNLPVSQQDYIHPDWHDSEASPVSCHGRKLMSELPIIETRYRFLDPCRWDIPYFSIANLDLLNRTIKRKWPSESLGSCMWLLTGSMSEEEVSLMLQWINLKLSCHESRQFNADYARGDCKVDLDELMDLVSAVCGGVR